MRKANKTPTILIDRLVKKNELGQPFTLMDDQRESYALPSPLIRTAGCRGTRSYIRASRSPPKPMLNGALTLWWAATQEEPNVMTAVGAVLASRG
jgi:hypothetical protein